MSSIEKFERKVSWTWQSAQVKEDIRKSKHIQKIRKDLKIKRRRV